MYIFTDDTYEYNVSDEYAERPYQSTANLETRKYWEQGENRVLYYMGTGLGKTVTFSFLPIWFPELQPYGMLVLVHRDELVFQAVEKLEAIFPGVPVGIEKGAYSTSGDCPIVVGSVQTLGRTGTSRINKFKDRFGIIVVDEAHRVTAGSQYANVLNYFGVGDKGDSLLPNGHKRISVGVTATPFRHDGIGLSDFYPVIAGNKGKGYSLIWGIINNWLTEPVYYVEMTNLDFSDLKSTKSDFVQKDLEKVNVDERNKLIVSAYKEKAEGLQAIAFCASVRHSKDLADTFRKYGIPAISIDGKTEENERKKWVNKYKTGEIQVLCNFGVFTEGFDAPNTQAILMCRPTKSTPLYLQMLGRVTRPVVHLPGNSSLTQRELLIAQSEKPNAIVIDFMDQYGDHDIATAPRLFGIKKQFKQSGVRLVRDIYERIQKAKKKAPDIDFSTIENLDEVETRIKEIDFWKAKNKLAKINLKKQTDLDWRMIREGVYELQILDNGDGTKVRLVHDGRGQFRSKVIKQARTETGGVKIDEYAGEQSLDFEEAIHKADDWIYDKFPDSIPHIRRQKYKSSKATDKQLLLMRKFGIDFPATARPSKQAASLIISKLLKK